MKLNFLLFLLILICSLAGCTHRVKRIGYNSDTPVSTDCDILIKKNYNYSENEVKVVGKIKLGDTGFSIKCEESDALKILRQEGCAVNADVINIVEEKRADFLSSCYRVTATFLKFNQATQASQISSDENYSEEEIEDRVILDKDRKKGMIIGSIVTGLIAGLITGFLL
ncbi:MAG: hypothetical protein GF401_05740 [Chitinivibrionales bacterium]|nr:hypothetical protein [Chitinivibrionales bacterium]